MTGKIIKEVHKCAPPIVRRKYNKGTVWQCDCGANFEIIDIFGEMEWKTEAQCRDLEARRANNEKGQPWEIIITLIIGGLIVLSLFFFAIVSIFGGN